MEPVSITVRERKNGHISHQRKEVPTVRRVLVKRFFVEVKDPSAHAFNLTTKGVADVQNHLALTGAARHQRPLVNG